MAAFRPEGGPRGYDYRIGMGNCALNYNSWKAFGIGGHHPKMYAQFADEDWDVAIFNGDYFYTEYVYLVEPQILGFDASLDSPGTFRQGNLGRANLWYISGGEWNCDWTNKLGIKNWDKLVEFDFSEQSRGCWNDGDKYYVGNCVSNAFGVETCGEDIEMVHEGKTHCCDTAPFYRKKHCPVVQANPQRDHRDQKRSYSQATNVESMSTGNWVFMNWIIDGGVREAGLKAYLVDTLALPESSIPSRAKPNTCVPEHVYDQIVLANTMQSYQYLADMPEHDRFRAALESAVDTNGDVIISEQDGMPEKNLHFVWSDHDAGTNNWAPVVNPNHARLRDTIRDAYTPLAHFDPGLYEHYGMYQAFTYFFGPEGRKKKMQLLMLDDRTNLTHFSGLAKDARGEEYYIGVATKEASVFSEQQWTWLEENLAEPGFDVRFLCTGSSFITISTNNDFSPPDHIAAFPYAKQRIFETIAKTKANGVVFIGGDNHFSTFVKKVDAFEHGGYPLYEIIASGTAWQRNPGGDKVVNPGLTDSVDSGYWGYTGAGADVGIYSYLDMIVTDDDDVEFVWTVKEIDWSNIRPRDNDGLVTLEGTIDAYYYISFSWMLSELVHQQLKTPKAFAPHPQPYTLKVGFVVDSSDVNFNAATDQIFVNLHDTAAFLPIEIGERYMLEHTAHPIDSVMVFDYVIMRKTAILDAAERPAAAVKIAEGKVEQLCFTQYINPNYPPEDALWSQHGTVHTWKWFNYEITIKPNWG
jgi:hypothetical protein